MMHNPAVALRERASDCLIGMLRWDMTGRALLVSDMPRRKGVRAAHDAAKRLNARADIDQGMLYIDLKPETYGALLTLDCGARGAWDREWFAIQALLAGILSRGGGGGPADEALLRKALLACARGERPVRDFCSLLRGTDAAALRGGNTASSRACAALMAQWLWTERGVGLPETARPPWGMRY